MAETVGLLILSGTGIGGLSGIAGLGTIAGTTIAGVGLATIVGTAAILGATIGLNYALRPGVPKPEDGSQAIKQAIPPRIRGYGTNRLAGYYMLFETDGAVAARSYDVIAFHSGRIGRINSFFLHDDPIHTVSDISLGGTSAVLGEYGDGRYGSHIVITTALGANSQSAVFYPISVWTSEHKGNGIAWVGMLCAQTSDVPQFTKIYPHGLPSLSVVAECSVVWDPRDPAQLRADESTWLVSYNPVIQLVDYLTRVDGGLGLDLDIILPAARLAEWMIEANLCDEAVATADGGSEPRYQSHGWFQFDNKPEDIINGILATCDGWLAEAGDGTLSIRVGVYSEPTDDPLTEKHILGFALNYGTPDEQTVNQLNISFTDPAAKYVSVQTEPWQDEDAISLSGVVPAQPLDLKWVQSNSQARRLAGRAMQRLNPTMTGSFTTTLYGLRYIGKRWVPLQYPFVSGLQDCVVEIQGAEIDLMAGRINWNFIRVGDDIEAYDPSTDEGSTPVIPPPSPGAAAALMREDSIPLVREDGSNYVREST